MMSSSPYSSPLRHFALAVAGSFRTFGHVGLADYVMSYNDIDHTWVPTPVNGVCGALSTTPCKSTQYDSFANLGSWVEVKVVTSKTVALKEEAGPSVEPLPAYTCSNSANTASAFRARDTLLALYPADGDVRKMLDVIDGMVNSGPPSSQEKQLREMLEKFNVRGAATGRYQGDRENPSNTPKNPCAEIEMPNPARGEAMSVVERMRVLYQFVKNWASQDGPQGGRKMFQLGERERVIEVLFKGLWHLCVVYPAGWDDRGGVAATVLENQALIPSAWGIMFRNDLSKFGFQDTLPWGTTGLRPETSSLSRKEREDELFMTISFWIMAHHDSLPPTHEQTASMVHHQLLGICSPATNTWDQRTQIAAHVASMFPLELRHDFVELLTNFRFTC